MTSRLVEQLGAQHVAGASAVSLAAYIEALILDGRLTSGERLPSERSLALELRRSRSTVTRVYDVLEEKGYIARLRGGGTRVALADGARPPSSVSAESTIDLSVASTESTPGLYDATVRSLRRLAGLRTSNGYSLLGIPELRGAVADDFRRRGVPTDVEEVLITSGALSALSLVLATIGRRGELALVEQPTFAHALDALQFRGYRLLPTPVDSTGWDHKHLTDAVLRRRPHLAYSIPDFHNPTGATMPDDERDRFLATARHAGTRVIVDETTTELDIDRGWSPTPMAAIDPWTITLGSMSKIAWGGLRIGWIRAERALIDRIRARRSSIELGTALLEQCIAIELLTELPALKEHLHRKLYAGRQAITLGLEHMAGIQMPRTPGGLSAWIDLGRPVSTTLSIRARRHGVMLPPGSRFSTGGVLERYVRIPFALDADRTREAMRRLSHAWNETLLGNEAGDALITQNTVI